MNKKKPSKKLLMLLLTLVLCIVAASTGFILKSRQYRGKYIPGTFINGIDASDLTPADFKKKLKDKVESYTMTIQFRDGSIGTIAGKDFSYVYKADQGPEELLKAQNPYLWLNGKLGLQHDYLVKESFSYDDAKLQKTLKAMPQLQKKNQTDPVNAFLKLKADGTLTIQEESEGNKIKNKPFYSEVVKAIASNKASLDLSKIHKVYAYPDIKKDDKELVGQLKDIQAFLSTVITYTLPKGDKMTLDRDTLSSWLTIASNGSVTLNQDDLLAKSTAFTASLAKLADDVRTSRAFKTTNRGTIEFPTKEYGYKVDQAKEIQTLLENLNKHQSVEREPVWAMNTKLEDNLGGSYVEVDLQAQTVYLYQNYNLTYSTSCVSGLPSAGRHTVTGLFSIKSKETDRILKGRPTEDGRPSYQSFVNFWMPFYGNYGLHNAPWRDSFGGSIYQSDGSHGCVNLSYDAAKTIFNNVSVGTPVVVF